MMDAKMSQHSKRELVQRLQPRYLKADRKEKTKILDEFVAVTGLHRKGDDPPPAPTKSAKARASWSAENLYRQRGERPDPNLAHLWRYLRQAAPAYLGRYGHFPGATSGTRAGSGNQEAGLGG